MNSLSLPGDLAPQALSHSGALLLDVENFPFNLDLVKYLKAYCRYPISVKLAVANWQNVSVAKLDKSLHQQGYQLIHVPKDKNAADAQILTLGASLQLNYPQIKDVVIVSRDSIFNYLHQTLQRQGCNTYQVYQQSGNIYLNDFISDRKSLMTKVSEPNPAQTIEHKIQAKIELTLIELMQKSSDKVLLSQLCEEFKRKYKHSVSETLKQNKLSKSPLNFIKQSCAHKIKVKVDNKRHYLSLTSN
ncbi:MAG: NYN domain-containing protein [Cyanobacteria bacterium P01_A01_bin.83]